MYYSLEGRLAVISGGTSGIGRLTAKILMTTGAWVVIVGRDREKGEKVAADMGKHCLFVQADLTKVNQCEKVAKEMSAWAAATSYERVPTRMGTLDYLVNCAGIYEEESLAHITEESYYRMLDNNLKSTIFLTQALVPYFVPDGSIINVASDAGISGNYGCSLYSASKGAIVAFTRSLALDLAPKIRVNCVCPGDVNTPLLEKQMAQGHYTKEEMAAEYPMGRIAEPIEIARVINFLSMPGNSFMTGAIIPVDGGLTAK